MASIALARAYQQSFDAHPYGTLALTNGALNALGDVVAQAAQNVVRTATPSSAYLRRVHTLRSTGSSSPGGPTRIAKPSTSCELLASLPLELEWVRNSHL